MRTRRHLIFTADDFGLHPAVNDAVEEAHRDGVLTAASLMVSGPAAGDAISRARRLPRLRVGLHLVLADGRPTLPPGRLPQLLCGRDTFGPGMVRPAFRLAFSRAARAELEAEIDAQFRAYAATGLGLDHVNTHKHFHFHPLILSRVLAIGRTWGLRAVRLPLDRGGPPFLRLLAAGMRRRLDSAGIARNDQVVGLAATGAMDEAAVLAGLRSLRPGVTEFYFHPAAVPGAEIAPGTMAGYRHTDELRALTSGAVRAATAASGASLGGFSDSPA